MLLSQKLAFFQCSRRSALILVAFFSLSIILLVLIGPSTLQQRHIIDAAGNLSPEKVSAILFPGHATGGQEFDPTCSDREEMKATLARLDAKYANLTSDKFTIALHTHERPKELEETLSVLTGSEIPSLHEIVIVWSNFGQTPPKDYVTGFGVKVRYRVPTADSLNSKLVPDPEYETKAVLLTDDDVYYYPEDLEFVFQTWRKFGQYRLVGALPRCVNMDANGNHEYSLCKGEDSDQSQYSIILTNLCFSHIAFLDYYWSDAPEMVQTRAYVDEHFNCEDVALNYVASKLTGLGPLEAQGKRRYHNMNPAIGISRKPGHLQARSQCLDDFTDFFNCQPLVSESSHITNGMIVL